MGVVPFGPSIEGIGFRRAFAMGTRGTPWMTRGSFIRVGSSFAGTKTIISTGKSTQRLRSYSLRLTI